jgi:hypothetical protein
METKNIMMGLDDDSDDKSLSFYLLIFLTHKFLILCSHFTLYSPSPTHLPLPLLFFPVSGCKGCLNPTAVSSHHG